MGPECPSIKYAAKQSIGADEAMPIHVIWALYLVSWQVGRHGNGRRAGGDLPGRNREAVSPASSQSTGGSFARGVAGRDDCGDHARAAMDGDRLR